jgi:hypothetical protein
MIEASFRNEKETAGRKKGGEALANPTAPRALLG